MGRRTVVGLGLFGTYADKSYVDTQFSVTNAKTVPSVAGATPLEAETGLYRVDATRTAAYELMPRATLLGEIAIDQLLGDAADSPLIEEEVQPSLGVGVRYEF